MSYLLVTMSRSILGKTQTLRQQQKNVDKPQKATAFFSPSRQTSYSIYGNMAGSLAPIPVESKQTPPPLAERESWNGYLSRAGRDQEPGDQTQQENRPPVFPLDDHSIASNPLRNRSRNRNQPTSSLLSLSPSRNHQSQDELLQFLNFRRNADGQYVKGMFSPLPPHSNPRQHNKLNDRCRDVLTQASKHLAATHEQQHLHDHNHVHSLHVSYHPHHLSNQPSSSAASVTSSLGASGIHSYNSSSGGSRIRDRQSRHDRFHAKDGDGHSRAHSYGSSDSRSVSQY